MSHQPHKTRRFTFTTVGLALGAALLYAACVSQDDAPSLADLSLRDALGLSEEKLRITFQSRFGPEEWLKPYTDVTVEELARSGVKRLAIVSPAFAADCVETLEELAIAARETFTEAGGEDFTVAPCLNASNAGMELIEALTHQELQGWR